LSVSQLERELTTLVPRHRDFLVDSCEKPIEVDDQEFHVDLPVTGAGRDEQNRCYLLVYASKMQ
jgi:hypothetical protein